MKASQKELELSSQQKVITQYISNLQEDDSDMRQQTKRYKKSTQPNTKVNHRQSQNIRNISAAYGGGLSQKDTKRKHTKSTLTRKNQTQPHQRFSSNYADFHDQTSTTKSIKSIKINKLNIEIINGNNNQTQYIVDSIPIKQKFSSIQPKEIRVENKRIASSPPLKSEEFLIPRQTQKQKQKLKLKSPTVPKTETFDHSKQKLKDIYDKIRQPDYKPSRFTPQTLNEKSQFQKLQTLNEENLLQTQQQQKLPSNQQTENASETQNIEIMELHIPSRHKIESETDYLSKLTGRGQMRIEENRVVGQQVLSGKISIIWIFAIKSSFPEQIKNRINTMYNTFYDDEKAVPLVSNPKRIQEFVNIPNCYFKIVTDIQSAQKAIGFRIYSKVIEFYIWNQGGNETLLKALEYKNSTRKVKGIFNDWERILSRAEDEIEEEVAIYRVNNGLEKRQRQRKFPNFLKLTDTDKTEATLYRINLYGAIKLLPQQKRDNYDNFMRLVLNKYESQQQQQVNIQDYMKIDHLRPTTSLDQARKIIQFYVRESFYYQVVNSMLRTMKSSEEFKPCILPFNETYLSIRLYYHNFLKQSNEEIPQMTLYRGCKLSKKDFAQLKIGAFVQMFGFMSTSKSQERALDFVDRDGYLFVIHVNKRKANLQRFKNFDHGFVDINRYGLASSQYARQQEVLFNALNVYQVQKIQEKNNYTYIHLVYGVIFDLLQKPRESLTQDEYETLVNYHYCTRILGKVQDQGDVFLYANELIEAKEYYDKKIKQGNNLAHNYYKLANVQKECGEIDQAEKNANKALKLYGDQIDLSDRQKCLKIFGIHSKNAEINLERQDYLTADEHIDRAMALLCDDDMFERAVMLRQRGEIKFKKGQVKNAQKDFEQSESIFQSLRDQGKLRKIAAYKTYYLSHLSLFCVSKTRVDLKQELKEELHKIEQVQHKISQMNENIQDELVKINKSLKDVSLYVDDREKYEKEVKKAQSYLYSLKAKNANDPEIKAKLLSMQAMINDYQQLAQSQRLMNEAIELIQSKNPFDMKVADYSKILAKMQKAELQKYINPPKNPINQKPAFPIPYDSHSRSQIYQRCKKNFTKTLNVLLYHAKDKASPQILQIRNLLGDLTFGENDYSQCEKIIKEARQGNQKVVHSEMAKTLLIMAKICFARGELKNSFETLKEAEKVLQNAMVNKHQKQNQRNKSQKYRKIFENSDTYLTIQFIRVNIYHKQKNHDLALKNINQIQSIIVKKVGLNDSHPLLADLLEARGCSEVFNRNIYGFDQFFEKAIQLREKQFGYYHPTNAKSYCAYAKFLIMVKDVKRAESMLQKAVEIISAFQQTNPHYWAVYYSQGYFNEDLKEFDKSQVFYEKSWQWAQKHFNKSHIAIKQVMLRYANSLNKSRKLDQSIKIYQKLQQELDVGLRQSNKRYEVNEQADDEKVSLKKLMYSQLCEVELQDSGRNESLLQTSQNNLINASLYKSKLNMLRNTYGIKDNFAQRKNSEQSE